MFDAFMLAQSARAAMIEINVSTFQPSELFQA
jgi:hypothetical protein